MFPKDTGNPWHYAGRPTGFNSSLADNTPPTLSSNSPKDYADAENSIYPPFGDDIESLLTSNFQNYVNVAPGASTFDTTLEQPQMTSNPEDHTDAGTSFFPDFSSAFEPQMTSNPEDHTDVGTGFFPDFSSAFEPQMTSNPEDHTDVGTSFFPDFSSAFEPQMTSNPEDHTDVGTSSFPDFSSALKPQMTSNLQDCVDEWIRFCRAFGSGMQPPQMGTNLEDHADEGTRLLLPVGSDIESLQMESDPQAYADEGSSISPISDGGTEPPQTKGNPTNQYSHCPPRVCRDNQDGVECGQDITCSSAPRHFRVFHGIKGMSREDEIVCEWKDCKLVIGRHNFIRHLRTQHMGHLRN